MSILTKGGKTDELFDKIQIVFLKYIVFFGKALYYSDIKYNSTKEYGITKLINFIRKQKERSIV